MRHHVYSTQNEERLCAFLDGLGEDVDRTLVSVHCIPDVEGPSWFVIWKQHRPKAKGAIGFGLAGSSVAVERRDGQTITVAENPHTGDSETCPHAIGKPRWCDCEERRNWP